MKLIDADELLETIETYTPSLGSGASPGFVAGVYYCLHHILPRLIDCMGSKSWGDEEE